MMATYKAKGIESWPMNMLAHEQLYTLHAASISAGLAESRGALLAGLDPHVATRLALARDLSSQILSDLHQLNQIERLSDGTVPLVTWLENAIVLTGPRHEANAFRDALAAIGRSSLQPRAISVPPSGPILHKRTGFCARCLLACAPEDQRFAMALEKHLSVLVRKGTISLWSSRQLLPGSDAEDEMALEFASADIILVLISADLLASDELHRTIIEPALRGLREGARVIPVLLRPCDYANSPFGRLQPLPKSREPITRGRDIDDAFMEVSQAVSQILQRREPGAWRSRLPPSSHLPGALLSEPPGRPYASTTPPLHGLPIEESFKPGGGTPDAA